MTRFLFLSGSRLWPLLGAALGVLASSSPAQVPPARSVEELRDQLQQHVTAPRFAGALWGVKVVSAESGTVLFEHHADRLMSPASNSKLFAGALALDAVGGDYRIVTPVCATAAPDRTGRLRGDLIISGRGDPGWKLPPGETNFWALFDPIVAIVTNAGIQRIAGHVIADGTWLQTPPNGASWTVDDLENSEGAEVSGITLLQNMAQLEVAPGPHPGAAARLALRQPHTGLALDNRVVTGTNGSPTYVDARRVFGETTLRVFGTIAPETNVTIQVPVPRPAQWFASALREALTRAGVRVDGVALGVRWPDRAGLPAELVTLGEISSAPMRDLVRDFMKPSQNLETDLVFAHVGELRRTPETPAWRTSEQLAVAALEAFLRTNGLPAGDLKFDEGSGLSRNNLATARLTLGLLEVMNRHRAADDFLASLPVAGVDGTLRRRMKGTPAEGNVRAKTGTLRWVNALSGHVTSAAGERLLFSFYLNRNIATATRSGRDELDALAVLLAQFAGRSDTTLEKLFASEGRLILTPMLNAPFPHAARLNGHTYRGEFYPGTPHYCDSTVAVFIPQSFRAGEPADLVVYFHGWRNAVPGVLGQFRLIEQLTASGRNAILVVPQGPRFAPDSFGGKLEDTGGFKRFLAELQSVLRNAGAAIETGAGRVILAGHSGGYRTMAAILEQVDVSALVREVWVFDGWYGGTEKFLGWQQAQGGRLVNIYTDDGGTRAETERALGLLRQRNTPVFTAEHAALDPEALRTHRVIFVRSELGHSEVVVGRETFRRLLETAGGAP